MGIKGTTETINSSFRYASRQVREFEINTSLFGRVFGDFESAIDLK